MKLRRRAVLKWTGAGLCALIFAAWFASGWCIVQWKRGVAGDFVAIDCGQGSIGVSQFASPAFGPLGLLPREDGFSVERVDFAWWRYEFRFARTIVDPTFTLVDSEVPLWSLFLPLGGLTLWLWRIDRRVPGACPSCGYSLSGLTPGAACPECGKGGLA